MKLEIFERPEAFLDATLEMLMENEALNNLPIGIARDMAAKGSPGEHPPFFAAIVLEGKPIMSALMTHRYPVNLYSRKPFNSDAARLIVDNLRSSQFLVPGVIGMKETTESFAELWREATGENWELAIKMRIYQLDQVRHKGDALGKCITAKEEHVSLLCSWLEAFEVAIGDGPKTENHEKRVRQAIAEEDFFLWIDETGTPVSMAASGRKTETGEVVNAVYTPPEYRGKGYATACVAEASRLMLERGARFCCLFADLANPTSNGIYKRIGYEPVSDYQKLLFIKE